MSYLQHCNKVDVISVNHFRDELDQFLFESSVTLDPGSVEMESKRGSVAVEMSVEVVPEKLPKLVPVGDVRTRRDEMTARQGLVKSGVVSPVQFVDDHLPDRVGPRGTVLGVTVTLVGHPGTGNTSLLAGRTKHVVRLPRTSPLAKRQWVKGWFSPVVESVRPDGDPFERSDDGGVVHKELVGHHLELFVATDSEVRSPHTNNGPIADVGKPFDYEPEKYTGQIQKQSKE